MLTESKFKMFGKSNSAIPYSLRYTCLQYLPQTRHLATPYKLLLSSRPCCLQCNGHTVTLLRPIHIPHEFPFTRSTGFHCPELRLQGRAGDEHDVRTVDRKSDGLGASGSCFIGRYEAHGRERIGGCDNVEHRSAGGCCVSGVGRHIPRHTAATSDGP